MRKGHLVSAKTGRSSRGPADFAASTTAPAAAATAQRASAMVRGVFIAPIRRMALPASFRNSCCLCGFIPALRSAGRWAPALRDAARLILRQVQFCRREGGPVGIRLLAERGQLLVIGRGLGFVTEPVGGLCGARIGVEAVRLLLEGGLERRERLAVRTTIEQHDTEKLARGRGGAGRDRMLLGLVLLIGAGPHRGERF